MIWLTVAVSGAGAASWAEGLFAETAHDFGPVPRGGKFRHDFVLNNRLAETLTILNVRASCGCTTGRASVSQVAPGQSAIIEAEIDTRNFVGPKSTVLYVSLVTAGGKESEARLGISVNILSDVVLNPGSLDFGAVVRGQTPSRVLTIDRLGQSGWKVERMVSASRGAERAARRDRPERVVGPVYPDACAQARCTPRHCPGRDPAPDQRPRDRLDPDSRDRAGPGRPGGLAQCPDARAGHFRRRGSGPVPGPGFPAVFDPGGRGGRRRLLGGPRRFDQVHRPSPHGLLPARGRAEPGRPRRTFRVVTDLPGEPALELNASCHVEP